MATPLYSHLDGQKVAQLLNMLLHSTAGALSSPVEAQIGYNSSAKTIEFHNGTSVVSLGRLDQISAPTAAVALNSQKITGLADPTNPQDAATRAYLLARTINDLTAPAADFSMNTHKITGLVDGSAATDAATWGQVQALTTGMDAKGSARVASTANLTLSGTQTIDGVAVIAGDRVLVKNQTAPETNGVYVVAAGAWTRATDFDAWVEIPGSYLSVEEGTVNADTVWLSTANSGGTLGTTAIPFAQVGAAGSGTIKESFTGPGSSGTTWAITHGRNSKDVLVQVRRVSDDAVVLVDQVNTSTSVVTLNFNSTVTLNTLRAVIIG